MQLVSSQSLKNDQNSRQSIWRSSASHNIIKFYHFLTFIPKYYLDLVIFSTKFHFTLIILKENNYNELFDNSI